MIMMCMIFAKNSIRNFSHEMHNLISFRIYFTRILSENYIVSGTGETVKNFKYLQKIGVTHVLNTAENDVTINPQKFRDAGICYKGFR